MPHTIRLHRVLRAPPGRVYQAFVNAEAFAHWLPPYGFTAQVHSLDARVGGEWRMHFTQHATGRQHSFGGRYLALFPGQAVSYTATFDDPHLSGEMKTTVTLKAVDGGTEMHVLQEGVPEIIPEHGCYIGWQQSLAQLAQLVEPEAESESGP